MPDELMDAQEQNEREHVLLNIDENMSYVPPTIELKEDKSTHTSRVDAFGKQRDEIAQKKIRGIRKAIFCKILTYSERTESQLSSKVSLTTIYDLYLLLRVPDKEGIFLHFGEVDVNFVAIYIGTTEVEDRSE